MWGFSGKEALMLEREAGFENEDLETKEDEPL